MIAIRVYKNYDTHTIIGYSIVNEQTMEKADIDNRVIRQMYRQGNHAVSNLELTPKGMRMVNMNPNVHRKWYKRTMSQGITAEHYCVITAVKKGLISFIADKPDGSVISGSNITLSDIAMQLEVPINELRFYNGYISEDEIGKTEINVFDTRANGYRTILEKRFDVEHNILGDEWQARIGDTNTNGVYVISLRNIKGESEATVPNIIYHMEKFRGGVNHLTIPFSMKSLGKRCFYQLKDLYSIKIKNGITEIPEECFAFSLIEKVEIPITVQDIEDKAFFRCRNLKGPLVLGAYYIGKRAFYDTKVTIVNLDKTEELDIEAFANNKKLRVVKLGENLREIGPGAFRWCTSLEEIIIPKSCEVIGRKAFEACTKLTKIKIKIGGSVKIARDSFDPQVVIEYIE